MKTEYIPGDLVKYTQLYKEPIAEIIEVRETSYLIRFMNGNFSMATEIEIEPIPIKEEILKKNGWKYTKITPSLYQYYKDDIYIKYDKLEEKFKFDDLYWSAYSFELPYVHTLQHLLFGLGLDSNIKL